MRQVKEVIATSPALFRAPKRRHRITRGLSVDPATWKYLLAMVEEGESRSASRAVDFLVRFFDSRKAGITFHFTDEANRERLYRFAATAGLAPEIAIETLLADALDRLTPPKNK